ncbi:MAG: hypothetical protein AMJ95_13985 [Omnitrophica WOR_2 bacterium SM23_72]|nr:MAG: hypothetical protein AMJ95_13985 [Omnitrophica WOR_2 bacterium SM23_72]
MRILFILFMSFALLCSRAAFAQDSSFGESAFQESWKEVVGDHFFIYYTGEDRFARDVLAKAEVYYGRIATDLGYPRYSEFWTWEKRVKIYIYPNHEAYIKATGQPRWSQGMADYRKKEIISYAWSKGFLESLLPHEMAHLIFRDFVGFKGEIPLWLDEGVAQWAEEARRPQMKRAAKDVYERDCLLSIQDMMRLDLETLGKTDRIYIRSSRTKTGEPGVLFLSADELINTYYLQSVSLVGFLIEILGSYSFADFCRQLRDGKRLEEALRFAYPTKIRNLQELEKEWRKYLDKL